MDRWWSRGRCCSKTAPAGLSSGTARSGLSRFVAADTLVKSPCVMAATDGWAGASRPRLNEPSKELAWSPYSPPTTVVDSGRSRRTARRPRVAPSGLPDPCSLGPDGVGRNRLGRRTRGNSRVRRGQDARLRAVRRTVGSGGNRQTATGHSGGCRVPQALSLERSPRSLRRRRHHLARAMVFQTPNRAHFRRVSRTRSVDGLTAPL